MIGTMNLPEMASFYEKVFQKAPDYKDENGSGWLVGSCFLMVGSHSEMVGKSKEPGRIMFNLETKEVNEEFDRIKNLGAGVIKDPYSPNGASEMSLATLSDPDGNFFQLMTPWEPPK